MTKCRLPTRRSCKRLLGFCATATKARQINDRQQQRAWRHLVQERLEQLVNELFLEVQVAVNDAAAVTRDMLAQLPQFDPAPRFFRGDLGSSLAQFCGFSGAG